MDSSRNSFDEWASLRVGIIVAYFIWPGDGLEYLGIIYAVLVMVVNEWEWFEPEIMENLFGKGKDNGRGAGSVL